MVEEIQEAHLEGEELRLPLVNLLPFHDRRGGQTQEDARLSAASRDDLPRPGNDFGDHEHAGYLGAPQDLFPDEGELVC